MNDCKVWTGVNNVPISIKLHFEESLINIDMVSPDGKQIGVGILSKILIKV